MGAFSYCLVVVTAADRAAATCLRWPSHSQRSEWAKVSIERSQSRQTSSVLWSCPQAQPSRRGYSRGDSGGRGRFSERSASPPRPLSPEERLAFGGVASAWVVPPERERVSGKLGCGQGRRNPSARFAGTSPFRGGFLVPAPQKECHAQSASLTHCDFPPLSTGPR